MLIYFISFLLIVGFFVINMFVGVVVENFHRCREQHELEEQERRQVCEFFRVIKSGFIAKTPFFSLASYVASKELGGFVRLVVRKLFFQIFCFFSNGARESRNDTARNNCGNHEKQVRPARSGGRLSFARVRT